MSELIGKYTKYAIRANDIYPTVSSAIHPDLSTSLRNTLDIGALSNLSKILKNLCSVGSFQNLLKGDSPCGRARS